MKLVKLAITATLLTATALWGQSISDQLGCTTAALEGDYGFVITGTRPSSPGGPVETIVGIAMTHFFGDGTLTQTDNIHGSISGLATPNRPGTGTYSINPDCTGTMTLINTGAPPLTLAIVLVDDGNEVRTAVMNPTAVVTPGTTPPQVIVTSNGRRVRTLASVSNNWGFSEDARSPKREVK